MSHARALSGSDRVAAMSRNRSHRPTGWFGVLLVTFALGAQASFAQSTSGPLSAPGIMLAQTSLDQLFESTPESAPESAPETAPEPPAPASGKATGGAEAEPKSADSLFESTPESAAPVPSGDVPAQPDQLPKSADSLFATESTETKTEPSTTTTYSGLIQSKLAYTYPSPDHWSLWRNLLQVNADGRFANGMTWRLGGRVAYDPIFDITNFYPDAVRDDQSLEAQIREAYIDASKGNWEFRIGRQHIIWGEVVGGFVADVVSAKDLRQSVVQDFDLLRIPQWAARAEYFQGDFVGEVLWIPYTTIDDIGKPGADFFPFPPIPPGVAAVFRGDDNPSPALSNSGVGARGSYLISGWDTSLFYYTSMDQQAAFRREVLPASQPTFLYTPIHERIHQVGATVTKDLGPALFKLESVFTVDRLFEVTNLADPDGLTRQNVLDYLLGLEWAFAEDTRLIVQFSQRWFPDHVSSMVPDELESGFSVYLSSKALHPDVKPEILWIQSLNRNGGLIEAKVNWEFRPNWRAVLGVDIFRGPPDGLFGQFDNSDRVYSEIRHTF